MPKPKLWPIFICYRRIDGIDTARRLLTILNKKQTTDAGGQLIQFDVYLDEAMPGVENWNSLQQPYLQKARAIIVVCTPGAKLYEGDGDCVHLEIDWWLENKKAAPLLIDPLKAGERYIPAQIAKRWPSIQRIELVESDWKGLDDASSEEMASVIQSKIVGAILPSGAQVYKQELDRERQRGKWVRRALLLSVLLLILATISGYYAFAQRKEALLSKDITVASLLDTRAAEMFAQSRLLATRQEIEARKRDELLKRIESVDEAQVVRQLNLLNERDRFEREIQNLKAKQSEVLNEGRRLLEMADTRWHRLDNERSTIPISTRSRPEPPLVFTVELLNAAYGESLLIRYGPPDDIKLLMINAGPRSAQIYKQNIEKRLHDLSTNLFDGAPVPLELFIVSERDQEKTGGLLRLLSSLAKIPDTEKPIVAIRGIWANIFKVGGASESSISRISQLIHKLKIPLNKPFDRFVVRPDRGQMKHILPGGMEIIVVGPDQQGLAKLHKWVARDAKRRGGVIEPLIEETFAQLKIDFKPKEFPIPFSPDSSDSSCLPSENAQKLAGGSYTDMSVSNSASSILLFRYASKTFLYTGDARGDLIIEGLSSTGLLDSNGQIHVDLMTIPHFGSDRNITVEFFRRVQSSGYLFSGDGRYGNPEISTVAALIHARSCQPYTMYFVNRDGRASARSGIRTQVDHGLKFDAFFEDEQLFNPNYRRRFRFKDKGSMMVNLLEPLSE